MHIEEMKTVVLEGFKDLAPKINFRKAPEFYFRCKVRDALEVPLHNQPTARKIAGAITVEIPALGLDFEPHREYLDELASLFTDVAYNMWVVAESEFGEEYALKALESLSVTLK